MHFYAAYYEVTASFFVETKDTVGLVVFEAAVELAFQQLKQKKWD